MIKKKKCARPSEQNVIRVSAKEAQTIGKGLAFAVSRHTLWTKTGELSIPRELHPYHMATINLGRLSPGVVAVVYALAKRTDKLSKIGGRLPCPEPFSIEACILGVRVNSKLENQNKNRQNPEESDKFYRRLIAKLEKHRKRQQRMLNRKLGQEEYKKQQKDWKQTARLFRKYFLPVCSPPSLPLLSFKERRKRLDILEAWTGAELTAQLRPTPIKRKLRLLLRQLLRYVRRGRLGFSIRYLMTHKTFAERYCAEFIIDRLHTVDQEDLVPIPTQNGIALAKIFPEGLYRSRVPATVVDAPLDRRAPRILRFTMSHPRTLVKSREWRRHFLREQHKQNPIIMKTDGSYIGQLIDDLMANEPLVVPEKELILTEAEARLRGMTLRNTPISISPSEALEHTRPADKHSEVGIEAVSLIIYFSKWMIEWLANVAPNEETRKEAYRVAGELFARRAEIEACYVPLEHTYAYKPFRGVLM